jgi:hypothetical protein
LIAKAGVEPLDQPGRTLILVAGYSQYLHGDNRDESKLSLPAQFVKREIPAVHENHRRKILESLFHARPLILDEDDLVPVFAEGLVQKGGECFVRCHNENQRAFQHLPPLITEIAATYIPYRAWAAAA